MITNQVIGRARDDDARVEEPQLQFAQALLSSAVDKGDERGDPDAPRCGLIERRFYGLVLEPEDGDLHALASALDCRHERRDSTVGLDNQLHNALSSAILRRITRLSVSRSAPTNPAARKPSRIWASVSSDSLPASHFTSARGMSLVICSIFVRSR